MKRYYLIFALLSSISVSFAQTLEGDRLALLAFYNATDGNNWRNNTGWNPSGGPGENPCSWYGVSCNATGDRVTEIKLSQNGLTGYVPSEIGNLTELIYLDLAGVGSIEAGGGLNNSIPVEFGNLKKLEYLNLGGNYFNSTNVQVLGNLTKLKYLSITPYWPIPDEFKNLLNLEYLDLSVFDPTGMSGSGNAGNIPAFFGDFVKLKTFKMQRAGITGSIPVEIGNLINLELLDLTGNYNLVGPIPIEIANLIDIQSLIISNTRVSGIIPAELGNLINLNLLDLSTNQLTGSIPAELGKLVNLVRLDLGSNLLTGIISAQLGNLTNLTEFNLTSNSLTGSIPIELRNLTKLRNGYLDFNKLSGTVPDLTGLPASSLSIGLNMFTFSGVEGNLSRLRFYAWQGSINITPSAPLPSGNVVLSVDAGGTLSNNTYFWYKNGSIVATNTGNQEFTTTGVGLYNVRVSNSVATGLTLTSNNFNLTTLPVTLTSFLGKTSSEGNLLTWETTSETNNKGFQIERGADAKTFESIGFVEGLGDNLGDKTYTFLDAKPYFKTYYRLKQLDWDGKFEYSRIIHVKKDNAALSFYPNPAKDHLFVLGLEKEENVTMHNLEGRLVLDQKLLPSQPINTSNVSNGLYIIKVGDETRKVLIQN